MLEVIVKAIVLLLFLVSAIAIIYIVSGIYYLYTLCKKGLNILYRQPLVIVIENKLRNQINEPIQGIKRLLCLAFRNKLIKFISIIISIVSITLFSILVMGVAKSTAIIFLTLMILSCVVNYILDKSEENQE